jgi:hypothetical protein
MNEENNFSINVNAEVDTLGLNPELVDTNPSEYINIQSDSELPESMIPAAMATEQPASEGLKMMMAASMDSEELKTYKNVLDSDFVEGIKTNSVSAMDVETQINSQKLNPMEINAQVVDPLVINASDVDTPRNVSMQSQISPAVDMDIKVEASDAYQKAESLEQQIKDIKVGMQDISSNVKNNWVPLKDFDEFEERPTTEPTNLLFEQRRNRISEFPEWS